MSEPKRRLRRGKITNVDLVWQGANWDMADGVGSKVVLFKSVDGAGTADQLAPSATVQRESSGPPASTVETGMADEVVAPEPKPAEKAAPTVEPTTAPVDVAKAIEDAVAKAVADAEARAEAREAELRKSVEALTDAAAERGYQAKAAEYAGVADEAELVAMLKASASVSPEAYDNTCVVLAKAAERIGAAKAIGGNLLGEIGTTKSAGIGTSAIGGAGGELQTLVKSIATEKSIPEHQAQLLAFEQRPDLYEAFRRENGHARQVIVGPNG